MKALLILGGPSGGNWENLKNKVKPDLLMGANGANVIPLDYWLCIERMGFAYKMAGRGVQRYVDIMAMFQRTTPKRRYVNEAAFKYLDDQTGVERVKRWAVDSCELENFTFREYGNGLIKGDKLKRQDVFNGEIRVGTVGLQLIHLAGILGMDEIHTIGFDLCFRKRHHWYDYPPYEDGKFFKREMFTTCYGLHTMWFWIETAEYMLKAKQVLDRDKIRWHDHSNGLLQKMGV